MSFHKYQKVRVKFNIAGFKAGDIVQYVGSTSINCINIHEFIKEGDKLGYFLSERDFDVIQNIDWYPIYKEFLSKYSHINEQVPLLFDSIRLSVESALNGK